MRSFYETSFGKRKTVAALIAVCAAVVGCTSTLESVNNTLDGVNRGFECADNNNSFRCADEIELGAAVTGRARPSEDQPYDRADFYVFTLPSPGVIEVAVIPASTTGSSDAGSRATLYNADQQKISSNGSGGAGRSLFLDVTADSGLYYLEVNRFRANQPPYELTVTLDTEDSFEINDTFAQAKAILLDEKVEAKMKPALDKDFYVIEVAEAGNVEVAVDPVPATLSMKVEAFNERQRNVAYPSRSGGAEGQSVFWSFEAPEPGKYYLQVNSNGQQPSDPVYGLEVSMENASEQME